MACKVPGDTLGVFLRSIVLNQLSGKDFLPDSLPDEELARLRSHVPKNEALESLPRNQDPEEPDEAEAEADAEPELETWLEPLLWLEPCPELWLELEPWLERELRSARVLRSRLRAHVPRSLVIVAVFRGNLTEELLIWQLLKSQWFPY